MTDDRIYTRLEEDPEFLSDFLKGSFAGDLFQVMEEEEISKIELARRLNTSRQYVTKVLNEEDLANLTIDSIAKFAAALKRDVSLRLKKYDEIVEIKPFAQWELENAYHARVEFAEVSNAGFIIESGTYTQFHLEHDSFNSWHVTSKVKPPDHAVYVEETRSNPELIEIREEGLA